MVYATAGGESVLRTLPADAAIRNLPVAPRPPTFGGLPPRAPIPAAGAGAAAAGAATASSAASTAGAIAAGALAFGAGFAVGDAIAGSLGIKYPGGKNALQYFFGGRDPGIGATGAAQEPIVTNFAAPPPFTGGQSEGVSYNISYATFAVSIASCPDPSFTSTQTISGGVFAPNIIGPIKSITTVMDTPNACGPRFARAKIVTPTVDLLITITNTGNPDDFITSAPISYSVSRNDGQPDTGGDPLNPQPGTLDRRIGAPWPTSPTAPTTTPTTTPTIAPPAPATPGQPVNPPNDEQNPLLPPWVYMIPWAMPAAPPAAGLSGSPALGPNTTPVNNPQAGTGTGTTPPPTKTKTANDCRCNIPLFNKVDALDKKLERALGGAGMAADGGILAYLQRMQAFAEKAWKATQMQKVLDVLTFVGVMHNVSMLSRDVGETMGYVLSQALDIVGIDDEEGNALDIPSIVGNSVENFFRTVLGDAYFEGLRSTYQKANRIVQSANMVIWTIRSISDSSLDLMEWVAESTGKIGNALKRFGVVGDRAYPWMSERAKAENRMRTRFSKLTDTLENVEDRASSLSVATSNVLEITQETNELGENWQAFKASLNAEPDPWFSNQPVETQVATETAASVSPAIVAADAERSN